ncbi:MAG: AMIN domain-containing protein [Candidatus Sulfotelmatobacter sp.]
MKLTEGILAAVMMTGGAWAQNPNIINNVQNKMTAVEQQQTEDSNAALGIESTPANGTAKKPSPAASAPAVKPAPVQAAKLDVSLKPASSAVTKAASASATKKISSSSSSDKSSSNKLERVKVVRHADDVQIELSTREAVTPTVDKLSSPDRVVVELPATLMATEQSKIAVGAAGIKGVRIGVNGKTPPTTSVVVDLEHAVSYEISPGPSDKFVLTLHVQGAAEATTKKSSMPAVAKAQPPQKAAMKPVVSASAAAAPKSAVPTASKRASAVTSRMAPAKMAVSTAKPVMAKPVTVARMQMPAQAPKAAAKEPKVAISAKAAVFPAAPKVAAPGKIEAHKAAAPAPKVEKITIAASKDEPKSETSQAAKNAAEDKLAPIGATADDSKAPKPEEKKWAMNGKRDPFFSPVVQQASGSGCSTGKKCLEIGQINVRGIVKSEAGFIAVVTNSMNKAYFLHENDPVFNGYVLRITGDSVVFKETYQDNLGKSVTREVTKTVVAPAV